MREKWRMMVEDLVRLITNRSAHRKFTINTIHLNKSTSSLDTARFGRSRWLVIFGESDVITIGLKKDGSGIAQVAHLQVESFQRCVWLNDNDTSSGSITWILRFEEVSINTEHHLSKLILIERIVELLDALCQVI